jgi:hypothetical protein
MIPNSVIIIKSISNNDYYPYTVALILINVVFHEYPKKIVLCIVKLVNGRILGRNIGIIVALSWRQASLLTIYLM